MREEKKLVPKRRFKEYQNTNAWEQRKLGQVTKSYSGGTPSVGKSEYYIGDIPFIRSAEINRDSTELFISELGLNNSSAKMVEVGDILYALYGATSGEVGISKINGAINQAILAIQPVEGYDSQFIMQWLRSQKREIIDKYLQGGQGNLSGSIVKDLEINFPSYSEQVKIGMVFKELDHLITLHQRKLEKTKALKSAYLFEMFPAEGECEPRRRFAGFTDPWEQCKLSNVADYYDGTHQTPKYSDEGVKFISVENIRNIWGTDKYISENDFEKQFKIKPQINDIFMTRITAGVIGDTALVEQDEPLAYYVSLALLRPKSIVPLYLEKYINSPLFKNELHMRIIHTAFPKKINLGDIGECGLRIPKSKKEQVQIGEFFKQLDDTITLHQRKLEKLQSTKKAYLNEMFV